MDTVAKLPQRSGVTSRGRHLPKVQLEKLIRIGRRVTVHDLVGRDKGQIRLRRLVDLAPHLLEVLEADVRRVRVAHACVEIKVQLVLQLGVSRGLREVLLAPVGRVYLSEIVSEFGPLRGPRRRDRETRIISTQWQAVSRCRRP